MRSSSRTRFPLADTTSMSLNVFDVTFVSPTKTDRPSAQGRQPSENGLIGSHSPQTSSAARRGYIAWRRVGSVKAAPAARASATITRRRCILFFYVRSCDVRTSVQLFGRGAAVWSIDAQRHQL